VEPIDRAESILFALSENLEKMNVIEAIGQLYTTLKLVDVLAKLTNLAGWAFLAS
jgi:hypothetical protein